MLMSPSRTFHSWGSSSTLVLRRNRPIRVTRGSFVILNAGPAETPNQAGSQSYDFADLRSMTPDEAHGLSGDPQFSVDPTTIALDPSGYAPKASSPALNHGTDLGFTQDFAGNPVPAGTAPDIGPYEREP